MAARELAITPGAVTRHIQVLEDWLSTKLFYRSSRSVTLTPAGWKLFRAVTMGLDHIAAITQEVKRSGSSEITILSTMALSALWLRPLTARYARLRPSTDIRLIASDSDIDYEQGRYDLAVRYGDGNWSGVDAFKVIDEIVFPVCAPAYARKYGIPEKIEDLGGHPLLHFERQNLSWVDWSVWFHEIGKQPPARMRGPTFNNYAMMIEATIEGNGIALGWQALCDDLLVSGQLMRVTDGEVRTNRGYFLITHPQSRNVEAIETLTAWIRSQCLGGAEGRAETATP